MEMSGLRRLAVVVALASTAESTAQEAGWTRCDSALSWTHAAEVEDVEPIMAELVATGRLAAWSDEWIADAIGSAPPIDELLARARREGKLVFWYVPSVSGQQMILPHLLDRYLTTGPFSEPEVTALIERRFLSLKLPAGGALAERFGLIAPQFLEPGLLVIAADGEVLMRASRINTFHPAWFLDELARVLASRVDVRFSPTLSAALADIADDPPAADLVVAAREAILDGEYKLAGDLLDRVDVAASPAERSAAGVLRAQLARRSFDGPSALAALARAEESSSRHEVWVERGVVLLRLGRFEPAAQVLRAALRHGGSRAAEAGYRLGVARYFLRDERGARDAWETVEREHPATVWGSKASACLVHGADGYPGESAVTRSMIDPRWPPALSEAGRAVATSTAWRRSAADADDIARRAVSFLLVQQRADGAWLGPRWGAQSEPLGANMEMAISALACAALREWRELAPVRSTPRSTAASASSSTTARCAADRAWDGCTPTRSGCGTSPRAGGRSRGALATRSMKRWPAGSVGWSRSRTSSTGRSGTSTPIHRRS